jgi:hypothetical protein
MTSYYKSHPEMATYLVHLTGRTGTPNSRVPRDIRRLAASARLEAILNQRSINGFECFGSGLPVVCMCEGSIETLNWLVAERKYEPWGLGLKKEYVYGQGGGPAYYVRSEELPALTGPAHARAVRFEPHECDWTHEREWRVPTEALKFTMRDLEGIYVGDAGWQPSSQRTRSSTRPQGLTRELQVPDWWRRIPRFVWNGRDKFEALGVQSAIV